MKYLPKISVIISAYNDLDNLRILVPLIFRSRYKNFEVIVVDDASSEDLSILKKCYPLRYFRNQKNLGVAETRMIAARQAQGEILLSLDNDVKPVGDLIYKIYSFFQKNPEAIAVSGFAGTEKENKGFFSRFKYLRDWSYWRQEVDPDSFYWFKTSIGAVKRSIFFEVGGYPPHFFKPGNRTLEDLDFSYRLAKKGKIHFDPGLIVEHPYGGLGYLLRTYFKRTVLFLEILKEKRQFPGVATTQNEALNIILGNFCLFLLAFACIYHYSFIPFSLIFISLVFRQKKFEGICLKREGLLFTIGAFITNWFLYLVILLGALYGSFYTLLRFFRSEARD